MLTPEIYQARLAQESTLIRRYQEEVLHQKNGQETLEKSFQDTIEAINKKKIALDQKQKLLSLQIECLKRYLDLWNSHPISVDFETPLMHSTGNAILSKNGTPVTFATLSERFSDIYKKRLDQTIDAIIEDYRELLCNRCTLFIDEDFLITEQYQSLIKDELKRFEAELRDEIKPQYQDLLFPRTACLTEEKLEMLGDQLKNIQELYQDCLDGQPFLMERTGDILSKRQQTIEYFKQQHKGIIPTEMRSIIYAWCSVGNVDMLEGHLKKTPGNTLEYKKYLYQHAPEALHRACAANQLVMVEKLIDFGMLETKDAYNHTPIQYAVLYEHENTDALLEELYWAGHAIDNKGPRGQIPLHTAALSGNCTAVRWLLEKASVYNQESAMINQADHRGNTPLHCAAMVDQEKIVGLFICHKALSLYNKDRLTPLALAIRWEKLKSVQAFLTGQQYLSTFDRAALHRFYEAQKLSPTTKRRVEHLAINSSPQGQRIPQSSTAMQFETAEDESHLYANGIKDPKRVKKPITWTFFSKQPASYSFKSGPDSHPPIIWSRSGGRWGRRKKTLREEAIDVVEVDSEENRHTSKHLL